MPVVLVDRLGQRRWAVVDGPGDMAYQQVRRILMMIIFVIV